jgi:hypothetical protein
MTELTAMIGTEGRTARALLEVMMAVQHSHHNPQSSSKPRRGSAVHFVRTLNMSSSLLSTRIDPSNFGIDDRHLAQALATRFTQLAQQPLIRGLEIIEKNIGSDDTKVIIDRLNILRQRDSRGLLQICTLEDLLQYSMLDWETDAGISIKSTNTTGYQFISKCDNVFDIVRLHKLQQRKELISTISPDLVFAMYGLGTCLIHLAGHYMPGVTIHQALALLLSPTQRQNDLLRLPTWCNEAEVKEYLTWIKHHWSQTAILRFKLGGIYPKTYQWLQDELNALSIQDFAQFSVNVGTYASKRTNIVRIEQLSRTFSRP